MDIVINELKIEQLSIDDYQQLLHTMKAAYLDWQGSYWTLDSIKKLIGQFSEGQLVLKADGNVVGAHCLLL